jgi:hypothetical protein
MWSSYDCISSACSANSVLTRFHDDKRSRELRLRVRLKHARPLLVNGILRRGPDAEEKNACRMLSREDKATEVTVPRHENTTSIVGLS